MTPTYHSGPLRPACSRAKFHLAKAQPAEPRTARHRTSTRVERVVLRARGGRYAETDR